MKFIETSAKTSKNVDESFRTMTKEIIEIMSQKENTINKKAENSSANTKIDLSKKSQTLINNSK